jgi:hypothetical protein
MKIELISCEGGDWEVLKVDGKVRFDGHSIREHEWIELLTEIGADVTTRTISDEAMEMGEYRVFKLIKVL